MSIKLEYEEECPWCHGIGHGRWPHDDKPCPECNGDGIRLSEEGKKILRLMEKYLDLKRKDKYKNEYWGE